MKLQEISGREGGMALPWQKMKLREISGGGRYLGKNAGAGADDPVVKVMAEGQHICHQAPDCVEVLVLPHLLKFSYREKKIFLQGSLKRFFISSRANVTLKALNFLLS
jgi:hypothetical protein